MSSLLFEYFTCSLHKAEDTSIGNAARTAAPLLVGMRPTPAGCCNSDMVGIAGVRHDQMLPVSPAHFAYPAESTLTLPNAVTSFSATPPSVTGGLLAAGAVTIGSPEESVRCFLPLEFAGVPSSSCAPPRAAQVVCLARPFRVFRGCLSRGVGRGPRERRVFAGR
ncbi:unnamed protein product [Prorocentrum cordatum]|uniref:Uncharacterized protein n=1 Tax=Prorocentrum cordatum TaxID=2364126 RepID=A0ABN9VIU9_9DINO|nr:unnamed protein product [Polarella glacialis]